MKKTDAAWFVNLIKDLPLDKMKEQLAQEKKDAEKAIPGDRKKREEAGRLVDYAKIISGFLYVLDSGQKPGGVSDADLRLFLPAVQALVDKKTFKPGILDVFK